MSGRYAATTEVPTERTRGEIERTLLRYGAEGFAYAWEGNQAMIRFRMHDKYIRMMLTLPDKSAFGFTPAKRYARDEAETLKAWEQGCRQLWRALALVVKAKLAAVEAGITTFESEFLAHIELPNKQTVGQWLIPQVEQIYLTGGHEMPQLLPGVANG